MWTMEPHLPLIPVGPLRPIPIHLSRPVTCMDPLSFKASMGQPTVDKAPMGQITSDKVPKPYPVKIWNPALDLTTSPHPDTKEEITKRITTTSPTNVESLIPSTSLSSSSSLSLSLSCSSSTMSTKPAPETFKSQTATDSKIDSGNTCRNDDSDKNSNNNNNKNNNNDNEMDTSEIIKSKLDSKYDLSQIGLYSSFNVKGLTTDIISKDKLLSPQKCIRSHSPLSPFPPPSLPMPHPPFHPSAVPLVERQLLHNALALAQSRAAVMNHHNLHHHHHHQQQHRHQHHLHQQEQQHHHKHPFQTLIPQLPHPLHPHLQQQQQQHLHHHHQEQHLQHHIHQPKLDHQHPEKRTALPRPPPPQPQQQQQPITNTDRIQLTLHSAIALAQSRANLLERVNYNSQSQLVSPLVSMETGMPHGYGRKLFPCPQCRYTTDRRNNLKRHMLTMHQTSSKMLECCGILFNTKAALREHAMIFHYHGYTCYFCGRRFCRKALLKRHLSVHNGQKDFVCTVCDYATSHKSNLERHRKVHSRQEDDGKEDGGEHHGFHDDVKSSSSEAVSHDDVSSDELSVCSDFEDDEDDTDEEINVHSD